MGTKSQENKVGYSHLRFVEKMERIIKSIEKDFLAKKSSSNLKKLP
jgi:hypothetical protein